MVPGHDGCCVKEISFQWNELHVYLLFVCLCNKQKNILLRKNQQYLIPFLVIREKKTENVDI